jgi:hypothetical protein
MSSGIGRLLGISMVSCLLATGVLGSGQDPPESAEIEAHVKVQLRGVRDKVGLGRGDDGELRFYLSTDAGQVEVLTPEEFAARVHGE